MKSEADDPSLEGGYSEYYQQQMKIVICSEEASFEDQIMVRFFKKNAALKIQMTSQTNISFFYYAVIDQKTYKQLVSSETHIDAGDFKKLSQWMKNLFSGNYTYQIEIETPTNSLLSVTQIQKYKTYQLIKIRLELGSEKMMKQSLMYRYERMKIRQSMLDTYWSNMHAIIKTKNPSLLLQMEYKSKKDAFK